MTPITIPSYGGTGSVRWNRGLQARFLHSMLHSKRACDLLMLRVTTPAL